MDEKKFNVIQCKDHIYIYEVTKSSYTDDIPDLLFDGQKAEKTYKTKWYKLNQVPKIVEQKLPNENINIRYELKAGYTPSNLMPSVINLSSLYDTEYEEVSGLYERKYDTVEGHYESIPFSIEIIYKRDDFEWIRSKYQSKPDLISQIEFHPDLIQEAPCKLDSEQMYNIIRVYVKTNINPLVAHITSDYDFHFEVKRKILIAEPYSYQSDLNAFNKRRKPNWVTKWINSKEENVLNLKRKASDSSYGNDCKLAPEIYGLNQMDLENKVNQYLEDLIKEINIQYRECPHCKGWGILKETENGEESI